MKAVVEHVEYSIQFYFRTPNRLQNSFGKDCKMNQFAKDQTCVVNYKWFMLTDAQLIQETGIT